MAAAGQRRGRQRELDWIAYLREHGWTAFRVDGSADVVAGRLGETWLIQVKSTAASPFERFGPLARERLREDAERAGWHCALLWWPKGVALPDATFIPSADWP